MRREKKIEKKISNFRHGDFLKIGALQSKRRVSPTSPCGRVRTYVREVKKCYQMAFTPSKSDKAQQCAKFSYIYNYT